jgi:branched-chain amino acid transport system permease protein
VPHFAIIAVSILFDGLAYAMFLFITSVGLSVTMGLMGFVNLAHGAFAMAGGYVVVSLTRSLGIDFISSLIIASIVVGVVSVLFERGLYRRLYKSTDLEQVLLTIGLAFMAIATATYFYGPIPKSVPLPFTLTFAVGSGLAALGGGLAIQLFGLSPSFAVLYLVLFLIVVAVGGLGSLKGTLLAALVLGIVDTGGKYLLADAGGFFIYAVTVIVLLIKPAGFYGRE